MDLVLNNLHRLICDKTQTTYQPTNPGVVVPVKVPSMSQIDLFEVPVSLGCRIHQLDLCKEVKPPHHQGVSSIYDIKQCNVEALEMLELWGMWSTPLLPLLPGSL